MNNFAGSIVDDLTTLSPNKSRGWLSNIPLGPLHRLSTEGDALRTFIPYITWQPFLTRLLYFSVQHVFEIFNRGLSFGVDVDLASRDVISAGPVRAPLGAARDAAHNTGEEVHFHVFNRQKIFV